jgi:hypothetical protein
MNPLRILSVISFVAVALSTGQAQDKKPVSPHETVSATIDGADIKIAYGRPYTKDPKTGEMRKIWGGLVPYGKVWRTGANEATLLTTSKTLDFGGTTLPAGTYSLFSQPEENGTAKLIINKQTGQWGTKYDEKQDFARVDMKKSAVDAPVDQFTITIDKNSSGGGVISLKWEKTEYTVPFTVKS